MANIQDIIVELDGLKIEHYECEDPFYSCAAVTPFEYKRGECNCGADEQNKTLDSIIKQLKEML